MEFFNFVMQRVDSDHPVYVTIFTVLGILLVIFCMGMVGLAVIAIMEFIVTFPAVLILIPFGIAGYIFYDYRSNYNG